ncbi:MAG TPA: metallophosphoesterase family protein [Myxococcaceae bacterium]|nr:metallophosphoesterase family protein [Myxococcaceae bacterium]
MRLALLSDLHANLEALEAVLEHGAKQGAEQLAFLGDLVGYGADPGPVVERVQAAVAAGALALKGNHDEAATRGAPSSMRADAARAVAWTREHLTEEQLAFLAGLPLTIQRGERLFVHASASDPAQWLYVLSAVDAGRSLRSVSAREIFCGHTHTPALYHLAADGSVSAFRPVPGTPIKLSVFRRWLVIPGSVGQPRDGNPAACYAMFDDVADVLVFHRVPYDAERAARKIRAAGLPGDLGARLELGG